MTNEDTHDELAESLAGLVTRLRRGLQRSTRHSVGTEFPSPSAVELLLVIADHPGIAVTDLATRLGAAPNTVSTLLRRVLDAGYLDRDTAPGDMRRARLTLSAMAESKVDEWRQQRELSVVGALTDLTDADVETLRTALPVLNDISKALYRPRSDRRRPAHV